MKGFVRVLLAAGGLVATQTGADTVVLDNGDRLSGTIVRMEAASLTLQTSYAGTITLPWVRVRQVESEAPVRIRLTDGTALDGQLQAEGDRHVRIATGDPADAPVGLDRINAINPPPDRANMAVKGRVSMGGSVARGNSDAQTFHLGGEVVAHNTKQRGTLDAELNEASQNGMETASNWRVGMKYDRFLEAKTYLYGNTRFDHDDRADLDLRTTLGAGVGRQIFEREDIKLSVEGGLSLVDEDYGRAQDTQFPSARVALKYEQALGQGRFTLFHRSDVLFNLDSAADYLYQGRTGVRLPVSKSLSLGTQVNFDYDGVPAAGKQSSDTVLIFKLDYAR